MVYINVKMRLIAYKLSKLQNWTSAFDAAD